MFIPISFKIPNHLSNDQFHFEVLKSEFCELDYEAVMSSKERLRHVFAKNDEWPESDMSFEFNKNDLIMFLMRKKIITLDAYILDRQSKKTTIVRYTYG